MDVQDTESQVRRKALTLLARREHSVRELTLKLAARGFGEATVAAAVSRLRRENLVSDDRFAEGFVRWRVAGRYGPMRIRYELRGRGVDDETIDRYLVRDEEKWLTKIAEARDKRFGEERPANFEERVRQMRFLLYRGFDGEQIEKVLGACRT